MPVSHYNISDALPQFSLLVTTTNTRANKTQNNTSLSYGNQQHHPFICHFKAPFPYLTVYNNYKLCLSISITLKEKFITAQSKIGLELYPNKNVKQAQNICKAVCILETQFQIISFLLFHLQEKLNSTSVQA